MAISRSFHLRLINTNYDYADEDLISADNKITYIMTHWDYDLYCYGAHEIGEAVQELVNSLDRIIGHHSPGGGQNLVPQFLEDHTGAEISWKSICEAWAADDFAGRAPTIAFIDRMRQLVWNEPFYAVWASRPESEY